MNDVWKIDENNLYLEISLIDFNEIPIILFICIDDNGARYAVSMYWYRRFKLLCYPAELKIFSKLLNNTSTIENL